MTNKPEPPISDAMIDETLDESFPASDPPGWTLGHEAHTETNNLAAQSLLALLSADELTQVARLRREARWAQNEEYVDLTHSERGVLVVSAEPPADPAHVLPRSALRAETWTRLEQLLVNKNLSR